MKKTLGGNRLGAGGKQEVELHGYERSTHDMGYLWRSTMAAGTLVPFMSELALPGDTFDINLNAEIMTHPTVGPLFGSYKVQLDVFQAPIRLYQGILHNNKLGIGMKMSEVTLPQIELWAEQTTGEIQDIDNAQINPSSILSYLNIRGVGAQPLNAERQPRRFNAIPLLAYWDIFKNYYSNKQEENAYVIWTPPTAMVETVTNIFIDTVQVGTGTILIDSVADGNVVVAYTGTKPLPEQIILVGPSGQTYNLNQYATEISEIPGTQTVYHWSWTGSGDVQILSWRYILPEEAPVMSIQLGEFELAFIDKMREEILKVTTLGTTFLVNDISGNVEDIGLNPYNAILDWSSSNASPYVYSQQGLAVKTYQSDLFNNWLSTEVIDGVGGINDITKIDTSGGSFNIDTLNLSRKVYDMLNRIAVSGGTYDDWLDAVYTHDRYTRAETPIYHGGLIKELVFQEVISNSASPDQPLGTLGGRGILAQKHKGGRITIRVDEPSYIMGIVSLTPRLDYSQGNKWDTTLKTMDDFHKPALDQIGFQELIQEQMAWWTTYWNDTDDEWVTQSAGKQPAWINYMTNVNQTRGNFAVRDEEMFMTLNRRYGWNSGDPEIITDLTTYIDPSKFNSIFADEELDAQNFWTQIAVDITARRKLSAKIMPNL